MWNLFITCDRELIKFHKMTYGVMSMESKRKITLFPRHPMMPHPTQETLGFRKNGWRSLRTQTDISMPTICLLMRHRNSCWIIPLSIIDLFPFLPRKDFHCLSTKLSSLYDTLCDFLFRLLLINEFHFIDIFFLSDPRTLEALRGTTSWNLKSSMHRYWIVNQGID